MPNIRVTVMEEAVDDLPYKYHTFKDFVDRLIHQEIEEAYRASVNMEYFLEEGEDGDYATYLRIVYVRPKTEEEIRAAEEREEARRLMQERWAADRAERERGLPRATTIGSSTTVPLKPRADSKAKLLI